MVVLPQEEKLQPKRRYFYRLAVDVLIESGDNNPAEQALALLRKAERESPVPGVRITISEADKGIPAEGGKTIVPLDLHTEVDARGAWPSVSRVMEFFDFIEGATLKDLHYERMAPRPILLEDPQPEAAGP